MTRLINRAVDVTVGPGGIPASFRYDGMLHRVEKVLDSWSETGRWWEQEHERVTYRVATAGGGIYELTQEAGQGRWHLYKSYD